MELINLNGNENKHKIFKKIINIKEKFDYHLFILFKIMNIKF